jgi:MFS family permease
MAPTKNSVAHRRPLWTIVGALGIAQIIAWGSLHYSIAVLAQPMARSLGISVSTVLAAFSAALLASGLASPLTGRLLDRHGGRRIMAAGSLLAFASLAVIASATHPAVFIAGWVLAGVAMAATLYDAAFATLVALSGGRHRQALTALTLFGGLASTVFWPLTHVLDQMWGWRGALAAFSALHLLACLPLHLWLVPPPASRAFSSSYQPGVSTPVARPRAGSRLWWLAASFAFGAVISSALSVHMLDTLQSSGLTAAQAVTVAVVVGPMQVAGRVVEFVAGSRVRAVTIGTIAMVAMLAALGLLLAVRGAGWVAFAYAALYGASNGVLTIVRGAVPAELFGRDGYGALLGRLAAPAFIGKAAAPVAFALVAAWSGYERAVTALCVLGLLSLLAYLLAVHGTRTNR